MTAPRMTIELNGTETDVDAETTVAALVDTALVDATTGSPRGVAVAVNRQLVPRSLWPTARLAPGDRVEVLAARRGG